MTRSHLANCLLLNTRRGHHASRTTAGCIIHARKFATSTNSSSVGPQGQDAYCRDFVMKHDRDAYLTSQFFPKHLQPACFAVRAFYVQLAMIQDSVTNPLIGQMRMQFWKDVIQHLGAPQHPIAAALRDASKIAHIAPYHLRRIVDARDVELNSPSHLNTDTLLAHAESTTSTLNYILLAILGLSSSDTYSHAASHLGVAQTIATLLRALPYHASKGVMVIPASITAAHHVNQEEVFRHGPAAANLPDAVYDFAVIANDHLISARELFKNENGRIEVPREAMPVFLNAVPVQNYLNRLQAANFDVFTPKLQLRESVRLPWQIWRSYLRNQF
ncbi:hypothetical protein ACEPAI_9305 [Sanghuangporus weigelae]